MVFVKTRRLRHKSDFISHNDQSLVTDQISIQNLASVFPNRSRLGTSTRIAHTLTPPSAKTSFSHISLQLSGEWHHRRGLVGSAVGDSACQPFSGTPAWAPKMMDPGSGDKREPRRRAMMSCFSSSNRWKNEAAKMTEMRPWSGVRLLREGSGGGGSVGVVFLGGASEMNSGSKISPGMNVAGKDSGVLRKSLWPKSQNSVGG